MLQHGPHLKIHHMTLMTVLTVLSSNSSAAVLKLSECEIEYRNYRMATATFYLDFENKTNLIVSNLTFKRWQCTEAMGYCKIQARCNFYQRNNSSNGVKCAQDIDLLSEITSTFPSYYIIAGSNFEVEIGKIRDLKCMCREFDLSQTLNIRFSTLGKALVTTYGFYNIPEVMDTYITATPNNALSVEKISKFAFQISTQNICQTYSLALTVVSQPTCTNWEIKANLTFPVRSVDTSSILCQYNSTDITIRTSACDDSGVYYTVIIESENVTIEFIQELTFPNKWIKLQSKTSIIAFIKSYFVVVRDVEKKKSLFIKE